jgi:hypothetical protein
MASVADPPEILCTGAKRLVFAHFEQSGFSSLILFTKKSMNAEVDSVSKGVR